MTPFMKDVMKLVESRRKDFKQALKDAGVDPLVTFRNMYSRRAREINKKDSRIYREKHNKTTSSKIQPETPPL